MVRLERLELSTPKLKVLYSYQLSYNRIENGSFLQREVCQPKHALVC